MSEGTVVTAAEIARLAGVGRAAVSNWRRRHADFPEPVLGTRANPVFRLDEVERWLRLQGKLPEGHPVDALWRELEADRESNLEERVADIATQLRKSDLAELPKRVRDTLVEAGEQPPDELIESLCARLFERQQRQHLVTPPQLAHLMVELAGEAIATAFDPACGPGNILRAAAEAGAQRLVGQEIDPTLARLARARFKPGDDVRIAEGDALRTDAFADLRADAVVCDPPFGYRDWGHEELGIDPRWEYGFPVKGEPELAWLQHCLAHTKPGGTVVLALPAGVASRRSGRTIRQALVRRGAVRAVFALPAGVLMSTGIAIHLWVLRNPAGGRVDPVLLADLGHHRPHRRGLVDWTALGTELLNTWREFRDTADISDVPGRRRAVEPIELLDEDVDLTPARRLPPQVMALDLPALRRARTELVTALGELTELLPQVREAPRENRTYTTIQDLAKAGALVLRHSGPLELDEEGEGPLVLTGRDVAGDQEPTARLAGTAEAEHIRLRGGDLVVPLLVAGETRPRTRIIDRDDLLLGPNLQLIRVDDERLDARFLAGRIRSGGGARASSTTASGVHRVDVRRVEIPMLDLERQRELGAAFQRLEEFENGLLEAANDGAELARQLTDGLAEGILRPE